MGKVSWRGEERDRGGKPYCTFIPGKDKVVRIPDHGRVEWESSETEKKKISA